MIEEDFQYLVPASIEEAVALRVALGTKAHFISGGTEVVPMLNHGKLTEGSLIDLSRIAELTGIVAHRRCHHLGASVILAQLCKTPLIMQFWTALAEAAGSVREPQIRNRGTIGGNVSHGVPSADLVPALLVFSADIGLVGQAGWRWVPMEEFLLGPYHTALKTDELVAEIRLPDPHPGRGSAFLKLTKFNGTGLSIASAAASVQIENGQIAKANVAIGSVGPMPCRIPQAEEYLTGKPLSDEILARAAQMVSDAAAPRDGSVRATPEHRRRVVKTLAGRAIALAAERAHIQATGISR